MNSHRNLQNSRVQWLILLMLALSLCSCSIFTRGGRAPRFESWLPADTTAMVSIPNMQSFRLKWDKTAMASAWTDPATEYWRTQQLDPVVDEILKKAGIGTDRKILPSITGQVLIGMRSSTGTKSERKPTFFAIADFGSNASQIRATVKGSTKAAWAKNVLIVASSEATLADLVDREKAHRSFFRKTPPSLQSTDNWRQAEKINNLGGDGYMYVDLAAVRDIIMPLVEAIMTQHQLAPQTMAFRLMMKSIGVDSLGFATCSTQMRGKGFYTRALVTYRNGQPGLFIPPPAPQELVTPKWVTRDLNSYSAGLLRTPLEMEESLVSALTYENPLFGQAIKQGKKRIEKHMGVKLDTLLGAFGSEIAVLGSGNPANPEVVFLWQIRNPEDLDKSLQRLEKVWKCDVEKFSYSGYTYESRKFPRFPMPIYTARVGNFFMISLQDTWLKNFATRREALEKSTAKPDPAKPAGPDSLLPELEKPFGKVPAGMVVVARAYNDPGQALTQLNGMLPLVIPVLNMQLQKMGHPTIPQWVISAIPPLLPFARNAFPTVQRVEQKNREYAIGESYSAFDPLASPIAAAAVVIAGKSMLGAGAEK